MQTKVFQGKTHKNELRKSWENCTIRSFKIGSPQIHPVLSWSNRGYLKEMGMAQNGTKGELWHAYKILVGGG
jgi:hypothetical protein